MYICTCIADAESAVEEAGHGAEKELVGVGQSAVKRCNFCYFYQEYDSNRLRHLHVRDSVSNCVKIRLRPVPVPRQRLQLTAQA